MTGLFGLVVVIAISTILIYMRIRNARKNSTVLEYAKALIKKDKEHEGVVVNGLIPEEILNKRVTKEECDNLSDEIKKIKDNFKSYYRDNLSNSQDKIRRFLDDLRFAICYRDFP